MTKSASPWPEEYTGDFEAAVFGEGMDGLPSVAEVSGKPLPQLTPGEIESVAEYHVYHEPYDRTDLYAILKLTGRRWASVVASCDATGWDCVAGSDIRVARTKREAIGALGTSGRVALGFKEGSWGE